MADDPALTAEVHLPRSQLDANYTARATVSEAEFARIMQLYQSQSDRAKDLANCRFGLEFCHDTGLKLDLFGTEPGQKRPLVVFIHGGYWRALGRGQSGFAAPMLAAKGVACAVPDYRLAPAASITDIIGDCRRALAYLWRNADELGLDRSRIVVTGSSAGGHLAAAMAQPGWQAGMALSQTLALAEKGLWSSSFKLPRQQIGQTGRVRASSGPCGSCSRPRSVRVWPKRRRRT